MEFHCPNCGAITPVTGKFCKKCAYALSEPKEALSVDYAEPQSYTPKFLADKILTNRSSIEGERKLVTVLFADVANYTAMSEKLDPEEVHQIMDGCFSILMDEIHRHEGTINQFTGDGVMALFGAPIAHEDHAQRACHAALSIQTALVNYSEKIGRDYDIDFKMRIGLNSGPVVVASIGDDLRMDYTAVGDTTNLAARIESNAVPGSILVSKATHKLAKDFFEFHPLGKIALKGKEQPQEAYELIKVGEIETRFMASVAKGLTKFVGRKNSMAALKDPYEKALSGFGQVVGIVGEAGVGKSRLQLEFINQLPRDEYTYLEGHCLHYGSGMALLPILDLVRSYFDIKEGDQQLAIQSKLEEKIGQLDQRLANSLPSFQELLSLKVDNEKYLQLDSGEKKIRIFEAIRDLFFRESERKPLVLAIEDLHWIDKTSEECIAYLIDWLANARILLILLYRIEYTHQWGSKSYYSKIGLTQLGTASSSQLVQAILEGGDVVPELRELILSRTGGNPLYVEEFTHNLLENGLIDRRDQQYVLTRGVTEIQVPETIQGIIAARIDRVEENIKRVMQVASVIGRELWACKKSLSHICSIFKDLNLFPKKDFFRS
jgi:class 3 adenylate cyclase